MAEESKALVAESHSRAERDGVDGFQRAWSGRDEWRVRKLGTGVGGDGV